MLKFTVENGHPDAEVIINSYLDILIYKDYNGFLSELNWQRFLTARELQPPAQVLYRRFFN